MNIRLNACYMLMLLAVCLVSAPFNQSANAEGVIRKPQFDPNAERVELFKGIEEGSIDYIMVMKDMNNGNLILENKTDKTITVEMPAAVAGIHVLPQTFNQIGGGGGGFGGNQGGGLGGQNGGGLGGGQGGGQGVGGGGGGFTGQGGGQGGGFGGQGGGQGGGGGGFFSIPAGKKFLYPLHTVCLEYGKPNPNVKATYKLVKIEEFTKDEAVIQLVKMVGSNQIDTGTAQASAWYLSSKKPWHELAALRMGKLPQTRDIPVFSQEQLSKAQYLVSVAEGKAREEIEKKKNNPEAATSTTPAQPASPRLQLKK